MSQFTGSWRVAVRAAWRDLRKAKGRNALIAVMVGVPVLLTVVVSVLTASNSLTLDERLPDELGNAQAVATHVGGDVMQDPQAETWSASTEGDGDDTPSVAQAASELSEVTDGSISVVQRSYSTTVVVGDEGVRATLLAADARKHGPAGLVVLERGQLPEANGEVMVTSALEKMGAEVGTSIEVGVDGQMKVVGIGRVGVVMRQPSNLGVLGLPGAFEDADNETSYLIDQTAPVTWQAVKKMNAAGFVVRSKDVVAHPPSPDELYPEELGVTSSTASSESALVMIAVTAIMIQIVLLAGPAFAVGVRRQRRDLALLAATGASPKQVRRMVLGQAVVIGLASCLAGAALGLAVAALIVRFSPDIIDQAAFGPFEVPWLPIAISIMLGVGASAVAAYVPARQASRQEVAAVLAGRRGILRSSRGWPVVGAILAVAGLVGCFTLGRQAGGESFVAASTIAIVIGFVLLTPMIIGVVGRLGAALPLALRLALRDTSRQRARSAPAIAAVMAAVAGVTAFAIASSSDFEQSRREYVYEAEPGRLVVETQADKLDEAIAAVGAATGSMSLIPMARAGIEDPEGAGTYVEVRSSADYRGSFRIFVADAETVSQWGVELDTAVARALDDGKVVVADRAMMTDGIVEIGVSHGEDEASLRLPAVAADLSVAPVPQGPEPQLAAAIMTRQTARTHDIPYEVATAISANDATPVSRELEQAANRATQAVAPDNGHASVERGFQESFTVAFFALLGFGVVAVMVGTLTATGLALSDARPDFSTLAAIGAAPRTRRRVAAAQAIVLATLGTLLGIVVGFGPGVAASWPLTSNDYEVSAGGATHVLDVPWLLLAALIVIVPMIAAGAAALFTRSRLPIVRRLAQ